MEERDIVSQLLSRAFDWSLSTPSRDGAPNYATNLALTAVAGVAVAAAVGVLIYYQTNDGSLPFKLFSFSTRRHHSPLKAAAWTECFGDEGKLVDGGETVICKVRGGGVEPSIRAQVWPFLLGVYGLDSTASEREAVMRSKEQEYEDLRSRCALAAKTLSEGLEEIRQAGDVVEEGEQSPDGFGIVCEASGVARQEFEESQADAVKEEEQSTNGTDDIDFGSPGVASHNDAHEEDNRQDSPTISSDDLNCSTGWEGGDKPDPTKLQEAEDFQSGQLSTTFDVSCESSGRASQELEERQAGAPKEEQLTDDADNIGCDSTSVATNHSDGNEEHKRQDSPASSSGDLNCSTGSQGGDKPDATKIQEAEDFHSGQLSTPGDIASGVGSQEFEERQAGAVKEEEQSIYDADDIGCDSTGLASHIDGHAEAKRQDLPASSSGHLHCSIGSQGGDKPDATELQEAKDFHIGQLSTSVGVLSGVASQEFEERQADAVQEEQSTHGADDIGCDSSEITSQECEESQADAVRVEQSTDGADIVCDSTRVASHSDGREEDKGEDSPTSLIADLNSSTGHEGGDKPLAMKLKQAEDFQTWQRIIKLDAVRMNAEWIPYAETQASVTFEEAARLSEAAGLKDDEHLEPSRRHHAARLVLILEAYTLYDPITGYCQGMSDLLSPFVALIDEDYEAFWCFVKFMEVARHNFRLDEVGIRRQLNLVGSILEAADPQLFQHLVKLESEDCNFIYRMVVVLVRRELSFEQTLCLWEVMWADWAAINNQLGSGRRRRWGRLGPPSRDLVLYTIAAAVRKRRKHILQCSGMDELFAECNGMAGHLDIWELLADARELVQLVRCKLPVCEQDS